MTILITGCAGFIGFHLTRRLLLDDYKVIGIDNLNDYYSPSLKIARLEQLGLDTQNIEENKLIVNKNGFSFIKANIEDKTLYDQCLNGQHFDAVCHLAAQAGIRYSIENPQQYISSNIQGFFNILEYCRHNPPQRLIFASSSSVYGKNTSVPFREDDMTDTPISLYAATKKSNELMAHSYSELYGINAIGLRFFTVYGPWGRPDMAPFLFTKAIMENKPIKIFNNGHMSRDFTYIDDIIEGIYKVIAFEPSNSDHAKKRFRIYNIGNSKPINLDKFISTIEQQTGETAVRIYEPMQPGDVKTTWADTTRLLNDYNYSPNTSIEAGLKVFIQWYKDFYQDNCFNT